MFLNRFPALKRWATFVRPFGTLPNSSTYLVLQPAGHIVLSLAWIEKQLA